METMNMVFNEDEIKDIETGEDIWFKIKYLEKIIKSREAQKPFLKKAYKVSWDLVIIICFMGSGFSMIKAVLYQNVISFIAFIVCFLIGSFFLIKISVDADWHLGFEEYLKLGKKTRGGR